MPSFAERLVVVLAVALLGGAATGDSSMNCPPPPECPEGVTFSIKRGSGKILENGLYAKGTVLIFGCESASQILKGERQRSCLGPKWTEAYPVCRDRITKHTSSCRDPGTPIHGKRTVEGAALDGQLVNGAKVTYSCDSSYKIKGSKTRTCVDGVWSGQETRCVTVYDTAYDGTFGRHGKNGLDDLNWWKEQQKRKDEAGALDGKVVMGNQVFDKTKKKTRMKVVEKEL